MTLFWSRSRGRRSCQVSQYPYRPRRRRESVADGANASRDTWEWGRYNRRHPVPRRGTARRQQGCPGADVSGRTETIGADLKRWAPLFWPAARLRPVESRQEWRRGLPAGRRRGADAGRERRVHRDRRRSDRELSAARNAKLVMAATEARQPVVRPARAKRSVRAIRPRRVQQNRSRGAGHGG